VADRAGLVSDGKASVGFLMRGGEYQRWSFQINLEEQKNKIAIENQLSIINLLGL
jgi:hypothetical protein